ncbi:Outer membrane assembly lipoprotein YfiO [Rickettsiales bacterium Ac37b]|nr:Outer membrane assembly lipoprotein YfiO [Rickettsiales bacterium Ac37b]
MQLRKSYHIILLLFLLGCNSSKSIEKVTGEAQQTPEELYTQAVQAMNKKSYGKAIKLFGQISQDYPYSKVAIKSQLIEAYGYYLKRDYSMAIVTLDNFISFHPAHPNIDYAYYLKMLCYYEQITDVYKDQKVTEQAYSALTEIIKRFPSTKYAQDATIKMDLVNDHLAGKEMTIGRFYLHRGDFIAAMNRFRTVIKNYQSTIHVQEALYRLVEIDLSLGLIKEAQLNASVLGHNYPESKWYKYSYNLLKNHNIKNNAN